MKKTAGFGASFCALLLLALTSTLHAETVTASVQLTPGAEVNPSPAPPANASGMVAVTFNITRNATGTITAATVNFRGTFSFPSSVSVVGFHIHEGAVNVNGPIRFDTGVNTGSAIFFATGSGFIDLNVPNVDLAALQRLLANPAGWYVNLHTSVNPGGAVRGQISRLVETLAATVNLNTTEEISPVPLPAGANGLGTFIANPTRNPATGEITGGTFRFVVTADLPQNSTVTGLHIHQAPAGVNGGIVLNSRISATNSFNLPTGKGTVAGSNTVTTAAELTALRGVISSPPGFYMNLHTAAFPAGIIRSQLSTITEAPVIQSSNTTFLATGTTDAPVNLWVSGLGFSGTIYVNGQPVPSLTNSVTAITETQIPAALRTNPGVLQVQARNGTGPLSAPFTILVAAASNVNTVALTTVDAARYGNIAAPDANVSGFGTRLSLQTVSSTGQPLPPILDGTVIWVNGIASGLQYVSPTQINYIIPTGVGVGTAQVVVLARDGTVSRGQVNIANSIPAIFTRRNDGTGAPVGVASADGANFNLQTSNPDGTPVTLDAGNYVALFTTGMRYATTATTITLGGTNITPLFVGAQGQFDGLDQVNFQIPLSLAGRGEIDLIIIQDNKNSNAVRFRIR